MAVTHLITAEQFTEMSDDSGKRFELVNGEVVEVPFAAHLQARIVMTLVYLLTTFVRARELGEVYGDGLGYLITRMPDTVRAPDVSFLSAERIPEEGFPVFVPSAPEFAIEGVSPNDQADEVHNKVYQYLAAGTRLV